MCRDIQGLIRIGGTVDAVVDYLYEECLDFVGIMEGHQAADKSSFRGRQRRFIRMIHAHVDQGRSISIAVEKRSRESD